MVSASTDLETLDCQSGSTQDRWSSRLLNWTTPRELRAATLLDARARQQAGWMTPFYDGRLHGYLAAHYEADDLSEFFRLSRQEICDSLNLEDEAKWFSSYLSVLNLQQQTSPCKDDILSFLQIMRVQTCFTERRHLAWLFWSACDSFAKPDLTQDQVPLFVALSLLAARVCRDTRHKGRFWQNTTSAISTLLSDVQTADKAIPLSLTLILCVFPLATDEDVWRVCDGVELMCEVMKCTKSASGSDPFVLRYCLSETLVHLLEERSGKAFLARSTLLRATAVADAEALAQAINVPTARIACTLRESLTCDWGLRPFRMHPSDGVGWRNLRNTCFLAASVNALFLTTPALTAFTKALEAATPDSSWPILDACSANVSWSKQNDKCSDQRSQNVNRLSFAWEFLRCLVEAHFSDKHILSLSRLRELCPIGQNATQEDVSELLHWVLNYFASLSCCGSDASASFPIPLSRATSLVYLNEAATSPACDDSSPASDLFHIKQNMVIYCTACRRRRLVSESSFAVLLSVDGSEEYALSPMHDMPTMPPPPVTSTSTSSSQVQSLTQSVLDQRDRPTSVASSVLELQSQTSSVTTRESSLTQISTDFVGSDSLSQLEDFRHSFDDVDQILIVSDLYKEDNDHLLTETTDLNKANKAPQQLTELINRYMRFETLTDYRCDEVDGCGTLGQSGKQATFCRLPQILVIVLNRFRHVGESAKIRLPVVVTRFLAISKEGVEGIASEYETFELYCAVIHCGATLDSGHYKVVGKPLPLGTQLAQPFNSNWFSFDDAKITPTTFTALQQCCYSEMDTPYILFFNKVRVESATPQRATTSSFAIHRTYSAPVTPAVRSKEASEQLGQTEGLQDFPNSIPQTNLLSARALGADTIEELRRLLLDSRRADATGEDRGTMASSEDNDETMDATVTESSSRVPQMASSNLRLQHMANLLLSERDDFRPSSSSEADPMQSPGLRVPSRLARPCHEGSLLMPFQLLAETIEGNIQHLICGDLN